MAMAVEKKSSSWRLQSGQYLGEISALCFLHLPSPLSALPYLLAGSGSQIMVYDLEMGRMVRSFDVFQGIRVHGIICYSSGSSTERAEGTLASSIAFKISVFGERRVKMFSLQIETVQQVNVSLTLLQSLPKFSNWVLDVSFFKQGSVSGSYGEGDCLAIGCSDNSVHLWDVSASAVVLEVRHPERTLLYSMRLWGDNLQALRVASGTIYNEIIVWKVVSQYNAASLTNQVEDGIDQINSFSDSVQPHACQYEAVHVSKLVGHEGSIFRIAWSFNGTKLVSVSDDRSARVWAVCAETKHSENPGESIGLVLFGHKARVWDCCILGSLIVTAGEDCTCRVWGLDGKHLQMIKEHTGRGIWRCLYDPNSSLLITAGFDSAIKVHQMHTSSGSLEGHADTKEFNRTITYTVHIPTFSENIGPMDSKSEYVRCLSFAREDTLYVSTNHGYLYHARLLNTGEVEWTELVRLSQEVQIVCMDLLSKPLEFCSSIEDWVSVGDGKGNVTIVGVIRDACTPKVGFSLTWSAGIERQLLGTHWSKSLGSGYIFTADPRGTLKLWRLSDHSARSCNVLLMAEFTSIFGTRIMCLDALLEEEVLVCGDIRGNLVLFPLLKSVLHGTVEPNMKISPSNYFKGAHGISSVSSLAVARLSSEKIEIRSTGADGCICYLEYERDMKSLQFIGMKQVKELSLIESVSDNISVNELSTCHCAAGFASVDFIIWNLITETKVVQIPCGGWRRPHSYYLGDIPEIKNCFAYVKDEIIYIHRRWVLDGERKILSRNLHMQFHGREMHSICFVSEDLQPGVDEKYSLFTGSSWMATGCEDGTVRLTRYTPGVENWSASKLLGEHVGGSAVRSICCVSKLYIVPSDAASINEKNAAAENRETPVLLISVGAKRVLTSWLLRSNKVNKKDEILSDQQHNITGNGNKVLSQESSSMSFQWLSTDMPVKYSSNPKFPDNIGKKIGLAGNVSTEDADAGSRLVSSKKGNMEFKSSVKDKYEDDWRYLAVTAFLVKCAGSRITVCFIVVACSDATLALRALVLPYRLWFDVSVLVPLSSPVLALQHVILPTCVPSEDNVQRGCLYILISGATDGSIAFWDLTRSIQAFMQLVSVLDVAKFIDCQKRPRTGRGSQGGRQWRSLGSSMSKNRLGTGSTTVKAGEETKCNLPNHIVDGMTSMQNDNESRTVSSQADDTASEVNASDSSSDICEISPLVVFKTIHQSGVNSLHVSDVEGCRSPEIGFLYNLISGGDDQALSCLTFELSVSASNTGSENRALEITNSVTELGSTKKIIHSSQDKNYWIRFLNHDKVPSAHSSAVKGVWTDGSWVFSTGLDQRVRCWRLEDEGKLIEVSYFIISVPEPEALDAKVCGRNHYQIAVAGRGMQMLEFSESFDVS
ncbi:hypothetical protein FF1_047268 [Malus domestica]|uniref:uncharacterized protein isoform X1 n=1 Tax=Malus domestica TaxID=3750 RepID=UPI0039749B13